MLTAVSLEMETKGGGQHVLRRVKVFFVFLKVVGTLLYCRWLYLVGMLPV